LNFSMSRTTYRIVGIESTTCGQCDFCATSETDLNSVYCHCPDPTFPEVLTENEDGSVNRSKECMAAEVQEQDPYIVTIEELTLKNWFSW